MAYSSPILVLFTYSCASGETYQTELVELAILVFIVPNNGSELSLGKLTEGAEGELAAFEIAALQPFNPAIIFALLTVAPLILSTPS